MLFRLFPQPTQVFFRKYENSHINWGHAYITTTMYEIQQALLCTIDLIQKLTFLLLLFIIFNGFLEKKEINDMHFVQRISLKVC